jgi:hypothetical protein
VVSVVTALKLNAVESAVNEDTLQASIKNILAIPARLVSAQLNVKSLLNPIF